MKNAFTMIELIFVIVVLGILAGIAIPKLAATRDDATLATMRANLATIQSAVQNKHAADLVAGNMTYKTIDFANKTTDGSKWNIKDLLTKPIKIDEKCGRNGFCGAKDNEITIVVAGSQATFTFDTGNGSWTCAGAACDQLQH